MSKTQRHSLKHNLKMVQKAERRQALYEQFNTPPVGFIPASLNRRTLQPHENLREIARRSAKKEI